MTLKDLKQESDKESPNKYIEEMELNEKHLSLIYDTLSDVVFLLAVEPDDCFRFMSVNQAFSDATCLTREQVVGKRIEQVLPETAHALVISKYKEAIVDNKTVFWEQASILPTGERVGDMGVTPVRNAEGVCTHLVGTVHDLTERKQVEEQNRFLSSVVEQSADGMAIADMEGNLLFVNDTWVSMHGYEKAVELLGQNLSVFHNEEQLKDDVEPFNRKVQEKGHYTGEVGHIRKDSTIFPTQMTTTLLRDENDNPIAIAGAATDISERKEAEEALRRAHENIKTILEKAPFGVVVIGRDRKIKRVNDTALKMAGVENADIMLGRNCGEYLCPAQQKECPILDKGQQVDNSERIFRNKDGKEIPIIKTVTEINIDGEDVLLETFIDNSERKRMEEALAAEAIHRRILMEQSRDGIVILDQDGSVYESNQRFAKMLGFSPEEVSHLHVWDWDFQFTHEQLRDMLRNVNDAGDAFETQHRRKDGTIYDVEISTNGAVFAGEKLIFCVCRDITERKAAEKELKKTTELLQSVMDNATDEAIITTDQMGIILIWNEGAKRLLGYEPEEVVGRESIRIFHTEEYLKSGIMDVNIKNMIATGKPLTEELDYVTKDGKTIPVQEIVSPRFDDDGNIKGMIGMARDITERKEAEEALRRAHENIKTILEKAPFGVVVIGRDRKIKRVNDTALKMAGVENADIMLGRNCGEYLCPAQQNECPILDKWQHVDNSEQIFRRKDGKEIPIIKTVAEINMDGEDVLLETFIDNSERKRAEEYIKKLNEELEQRVKDRTAELKKKNKNLEIMNEGFIGRELRMVELKKRIAELEKNAVPDKKTRG